MKNDPLNKRDRRALRRIEAGKTDVKTLPARRKEKLGIKSPEENEQDGRALALAAQSLAHAHSMLQDATHRLGGTTISDENRRFLNRASRLNDVVLKLTKQVAAARDRADGY